MAKSMLGLNNVSSAKFGTTDIKMYLGTNLLYPLYKAKIKLSTTNDYVYVPFDGSNTTLTRAEVETAVGDSVLTAITDVELTHAVITADSGCFTDAVNCTALTLSNSLTTVGSGAFAGLNVEHLVVPDNVRTLDSGAFADSHSMRTAVLGSGITEVGNSIFGSSYNTNTVESITFKSVVPPTPTASDEFLEYTDDCPIYVPSGSVQDYKTAWYKYASRIQAMP